MIGKALSLYKNLRKVQLSYQRESVNRGFTETFRNIHKKRTNILV